MNNTQTLYRLTWIRDGEPAQFIGTRWYEVVEEYRRRSQQYSGNYAFDVQVGVVAWSDIDRSLNER